jgi:hypothetical protein
MNNEIKDVFNLIGLKIDDLVDDIEQVELNNDQNI